MFLLNYFSEIAFFSSDLEYVFSTPSIFYFLEIKRILFVTVWWSEYDVLMDLEIHSVSKNYTCLNF